MAKSGTKLGPVDLSSDIPPCRGIYWPRAVLSWVQLTWGQTYPPVEASIGQEQYSVESS